MGANRSGFTIKRSGLARMSFWFAALPFPFKKHFCCCCWHEAPSAPTIMGRTRCLMRSSVQLIRRIYRSLVATVKTAVRALTGAARAPQIVLDLVPAADWIVEPPPGIEPPLAVVHSHEEHDESLLRFQAGLGILVDPLVSGATYTSRKPRKWRVHMPMLARAAADCLGVFPRLFPDAPLTDHELRQLERQVQRLGSFLSLLDHARELLERALQSRKQELADRTMEVVDQIHLLSKMPQQAAELTQEIRDARALVDAVLQPGRAQV